MEHVKYDIGYGLSVDSLHCKKCGFNITDSKQLKTAIGSLRKQMEKEVKIIKVGAGLGVRLPNNLVKSYRLKKGEDILLRPEEDGIKLVVEESTK
ncbi:MAG: AbrB/MazE/SpoVT family DNA-binding domain-containing protein [Nanoarchaeota archaeon]